MSHATARHARDGKHPVGRPAALGLACASFVLLTAACAAQPPARTASGHPRPSSRQAVNAAARSLAARYLVIAQAGNHRLDHDFDALAKPDRDRLAAADADLRDIVSTERTFDKQLAGIAFAPPVKATAARLIAVNQARALLTMTAASSASLSQLHAWEPRLDQANVPVEQAVRILRRELGLPPPDTS